MQTRPRRLAACISVVLLAALGASSAMAQERTDPVAVIAAQQQALTALRAMHGAWRGSAWVLEPGGQKRSFVQTERIGPFLDGSVLVIEGRGHDAAGKVSFNAMGIVSYDPAARTYSMRSHALGRSGDFAFVPTPDGYRWEIPAGPATIRYSATIRDGSLHEVGDRVVPGQEPQRIFEMNLKRIGDTDWPAAGAIGPR
ncbi:MAG: DUF1579 domain-containing protein [Burkholderiaceae bacterium]